MFKRPFTIIAASVLAAVLCPGISYASAAQEKPIRAVNANGRMVFMNIGDHAVPVPSAVMRVPSPGPVVLKTVFKPITIQTRVIPSPLPPPPRPGARPSPASLIPPVTRTTGTSNLDTLPAQIGTLVRTIAHRHGVDPELVSAVIKTESNFDRWAVSSKGARGLMQLIPETGRRFGVQDFFDPRQNIEGGVQYLKFLLDKFDGSVELSVAAYNAGEGIVERLGRVPPYAETREYVRRVRALYPNRIGWLAPSLEKVEAMGEAEPIVRTPVETRTEPPNKWTPPVEPPRIRAAEVPAIAASAPTPKAVAVTPVPEAPVAAGNEGVEESRILRTIDARGVYHFSNVN